MVTYAIGDVQGCAVTLQRLLTRLRGEAGFDPARDALWLTGDLVNRGPRSLEVLRWARTQSEEGPLRERLVVVLGNHDLHLLGLAAGAGTPGRKDTLGDVLAAPDLPGLVEWLRRRPLLHVGQVHGRPHALVHAGLPPDWSVARAAALAGELQSELAGPRWREALAEVRRRRVERWDEAARGGPRLAAIAATLTRLRTLGRGGRLELEFKGPPGDAPAGSVPWYAAPAPAWGDHVIVCGHWAALGLHLQEDVVACDTGCVWGGSLTAVRLAARGPERAVWQERNAEGTAAAR